MTSNKLPTRFFLIGAALILLQLGAVDGLARPD